MKVGQLMNPNVVAVTPETSLKDLSRLLSTHGIAGVPVARDGRVLGVVSEADILWKELGAVKGTGMLERVVDSAYGEGKRVSARTAGEAMTSPAITTSPDTDVTWVAALMTRLNINRLPVVEDGMLVGIITRSDLVRAFSRTDEEIVEEIREDVLEPLWLDPDCLSVTVVQGIVTVSGEVENRSTARLIETYIRHVPGVVSVHADLCFQIDDLARRVVTSAAHLPRRI
jgi:CBS domain-containing protein